VQKKRSGKDALLVIEDKYGKLDLKENRFKKKSRRRRRMKMINLSGNFLSCAIDGDQGAEITELKYRGRHIIDGQVAGPYPENKSFGLVALIPCVHHATLKELIWHGTGHPVLNSIVNDAHSDWGLGWKSQWQTLEQHSDIVMLSLEHRAEKNWPWFFDASQVIRLRDDKLVLTLSLTNQSKVPSPVGLGWAMSFPIERGQQLNIKAKNQYALTHKTSKPLIKVNLSDREEKNSQVFNIACHELAHAQCFGGWDGQLELRTKHDGLNLVSNLKTVQASLTNDGASLSLKVLDLPMDVLKHKALAQMLEPGESVSIEMSLSCKALGLSSL
jgi:hypothetical protein